MIDGEAIARAEHVLQVVYGGDLGRQLASLQVDRPVVDNLVQHVWDVIDARNPDRAAMSGNLTAGINVGFVHMFLVGLIAGRNSVREIA